MRNFINIMLEYVMTESDDFQNKSEMASAVYDVYRMIESGSGLEEAIHAVSEKTSIGTDVLIAAVREDYNSVRNSEHFPASVRLALRSWDSD